VTEDGENSFHKTALFAVHLDVLIVKKFNQRLRHGHGLRFHIDSSTV
jgi:hypothetical protein